MCYHIQADFGCDEAGGGHSADFPRRLWGISAEQVRLEAGRRNEGNKAQNAGHATKKACQVALRHILIDCTPNAIIVFLELENLIGGHGER